MTNYEPIWKGRTKLTLAAKRNQFIKAANLYAKTKSDVHNMLHILKTDPTLQSGTPFQKKQRAAIKRELENKFQLLKHQAKMYNAMLGDVSPRPLRADQFVKPVPGERRGIVIPFSIKEKLLKGRPYIGSGRLTIPVHNNLDEYNPPPPKVEPIPTGKKWFERRVNYQASEEQQKALRERIFSEASNSAPINSIEKQAGEDLDKVMPNTVLNIEPDLPNSRRLRLRKQLKQVRKDVVGQKHKRVSLKDVVTGETLHVDRQTAQVMGVDLQEAVTDIASKQVIPIGGIPLRNSLGIQIVGNRKVTIKTDVLEERAMQPQRTKRGAWKIKTKKGEWRWMSREELRNFHQRQSKAHRRAEKSMYPRAHK